MRMFSLVCALLALSGGCATHTPMPTTFVYDSTLLDGVAIFGEQVEPSEQVQLLTTSPAMVEFVASEVGSTGVRFIRFRRLMAALVKGGYFVDQYDRDATYTADKTFAEHKGNCLAYTNMFIALAREANIDARYQLVDTHPAWDVKSGYLVRSNHVNVVLRDAALAGTAHRNVTVDFNTFTPAPDVSRKVVGDAYAESMFYGNLAVNKLHARDYKGAFAYLKRGILTEPRNIDLWNNLGALMSIVDHPAHAQAAYETALQLDVENKTALSGMAKSLRQLGRFEQAERYTLLSLKYQKRNPYYHYAVAEQAFRENAYEDALDSVNRAIKLQRDNARFYVLRAATAEELGDGVLVESSIAMAVKYGRREAAEPKPFLFN